MKEFFGFGGYERTPEGAWSLQHLLLVCSLMLMMVGAAILLGRANRHKDSRAKNRVLIATAIAIDAIELFC